LREDDNPLGGNGLASSETESKQINTVPMEPVINQGGKRVLLPGGFVARSIAFPRPAIMRPLMMLCAKEPVIKKAATSLALLPGGFVTHSLQITRICASFVPRHQAKFLR
jgi:hypothetical protein